MERRTLIVPMAGGMYSVYTYDSEISNQKPDANRSKRDRFSGLTKTVSAGLLVTTLAGSPTEAASTKLQSTKPVEKDKITNIKNPETPAQRPSSVAPTSIPEQNQAVGENINILPPLYFNISNTALDAQNFDHSQSTFISLEQFNNLTATMVGGSLTSGMIRDEVAKVLTLVNGENAADKINQTIAVLPDDIGEQTFFANVLLADAGLKDSQGNDIPEGSILMHYVDRNNQDQLAVMQSKEDGTRLSIILGVSGGQLVTVVAREKDNDNGNSEVVSVLGFLPDGRVLEIPVEGNIFDQGTIITKLPTPQAPGLERVAMVSEGTFVMSLDQLSEFGDYTTGIECVINGHRVYVVSDIPNMQFMNLNVDRLRQVLTIANVNVGRDTLIRLLYNPTGAMIHDEGVNPNDVYGDSTGGSGIVFLAPSVNDNLQVDTVYLSRQMIQDMNKHFTLPDGSDFFQLNALIDIQIVSAFLTQNITAGFSSQVDRIAATLQSHLDISQISYHQGVSENTSRAKKMPQEIEIMTNKRTPSRPKNFVPNETYNTKGIAQR